MEHKVKQFSKITMLFLAYVSNKLSKKKVVIFMIFHLLTCSSKRSIWWWEAYAVAGSHHLEPGQVDVF